MSGAFGAQLRQARQARGFSLRDLGAATTYAYGHLSKVENETRSPTLDLAERVDAVLGSNLVELAHQQQRQMQAEASPPSRPAELPPVGAFIGRTDDLQALSAAAAQAPNPGSPRLIAIDGPPGGGKTSLAVYWGHQQREHYPDGQLYINLRGYDPQAPASPSSVLEELLRKLGVPTAVIPASVDERTALLRTVTDGKRLLLVADNARDSEQVLPLLPAEASTVLVTSRTRLAGLEARAGAAHSVLAPMQPDEAEALLSHIIGHERAGSDAHAVRQLAARCDYLPLALHVAGQHVTEQPHHSLAGLVGALEGHRLAALDAAGEHLAVSVRAAFGWSYQALDSSTAGLFRALGHHPGSEVALDAAAAAHLGTLADTRQDMHRLAGAHLLELTDRDRWQSHDLLRAYAAERSQQEDTSEQRDQIVLRLIEWYLHTAANANDVLAPLRKLPALPQRRTGIEPSEFADYDTALAWCDREAANIVFVIGLAQQHQHYELAWLLAVVGFNYYYLSKRRNAWIGSHQRALAAARDAGDRIGEAWCLHNLSAAWAELRQWDHALPSLDEAIRLRRELGDTWGLGWSLFAAGTAALDRGSPDTAESNLREALAVFEDMSFDYGRGAILSQLGSALRKQGHTGEARTTGQQSLEVFDGLGASDGQAFALLRLGATHTVLGEPEQALQYLDRALKLREQDHDQWGAAEVELSRGHALRDCGAIDQARAAWNHAAEQFDAWLDPRGAEARAQLAIVDDISGGSAAMALNSHW